MRPSAGPHNRVHVRTCGLCVRLCPSRPTVYSSTEYCVSVCNAHCCHDAQDPQTQKNRGFTAPTPKWALSSPHAQGRSLLIANPNHIPLPSRDILACNGKKAMARATATLFTPGSNGGGDFAPNSILKSSITRRQVVGQRHDGPGRSSTCHPPSQRSSNTWQCRRSAVHIGMGQFVRRA